MFEDPQPTPVPPLPERDTVEPAAAVEPVAAVPTPSVSPAVERFQSCRWRKAADAHDPSEHCTHRDVLPFAGTTGFKPEAWCPDCTYYKLRRTPKKRDRNEYGY